MQVPPQLNKLHPHRDQLYSIFKNSVQWFLRSRRFVDPLILNIVQTILDNISANNESDATT